MLDNARNNHALLYLACEYRELDNSKEKIGSDNPREDVAQGLDNPWTNCVHVSHKY